MYDDFSLRCNVGFRFFPSVCGYSYGACTVQSSNRGSGDAPCMLTRPEAVAPHFGERVPDRSCNQSDEDLAIQVAADHPHTWMAIGVEAEGLYEICDRSPGLISHETP